MASTVQFKAWYLYLLEVVSAIFTRPFEHVSSFLTMFSGLCMMFVSWDLCCLN